MPRYIDADALTEEIKSLSITITGFRGGKCYWSKIVEEYKDSILRIINEQATADVVEVVRCKDCKHYKPQTGAQNWNSKVKYCCRCAVVKVKETDFCSFGERKE